MGFLKINEIEKALLSIGCKTYTLDMKFDENTRIFIEKKPEEPVTRMIGFNTEQEEKHESNQ